MSTTPANNTTGVAITTTITAIVSEPLDAASVTGTSVFLQSGVTVIPATLAYTPGSTTITLTPSSPLSEKTLYTVTLKGGVGADKIMDVAGNALAADYVWGFTTGDFTAPTVVSATPANNAINVLTTATITAIVSEPLDAASVTSTSVLLNNGVITVPATLGYTPGSTTVTLTPLSPLSEKTLYTVTLKGGVGADRILDAAGNALSADYVWSFTTIDQTAPTVVSTTPANNTTGVAITTTITAIVSEPLDAASVTSTSVLLNNGTISVPATLSYTPGSTTITLTPSSPLSEKTLYTVTLKGGLGSDRILDASGNALSADYVWSFTTGDFTAPTVVSATPANNAINVLTTATITAIVSEPLDAASVTSTSVLLNNGVITVPATLGYTPGSTTVTLTPLSPLSEKTLYTVTLKGGVGADRILDAAGNALAADYVWSFTTIDQTAPTVVSTTPANNTTGVAITTTITAIVSEPLDAASVTSTSVLLNNGAISVPATLSYTPGSTTITLTPSAPLATSTVYMVTLKGGTGTNKILDASGNALAADYIWNFTTAAPTDATPPASVITSPSSGVSIALNVPVTITGTASDAGTITQVQVSVDGGTTWQLATGTNNWTFTWNPSTAGTITIKSRGTDQTGNVELAGTAPAGNAINVTVAAGVGVNILTTTQKNQATSSQSENDGSAIELGVKFRASVNGYITGLRYYKSSANTGTHIGQLWSSSGTLLAQATYTGETSSGWQQVNLTNPVAITAGVTYIAAYHSSAGNYSATNNFFTSTVANGPLKNLANGEDGSNGLYRYTSTPAFPNSSYSSTSYWVDVVFATGAGTDITPPTVISTSPATNATGVAINASITAVFSEPLSASSLTASSVYLRAGATSVPATLSYTPGSTNVVLTPSAPLNSSTVYTVTLKGGTGAARILDIAGNALAADYVWSFTTVDQAAPTVVSTTPAANATGVATTTNITAVFSEALSASSVTASSVYLRAGAISVPATLSYTAGSTNVTLTPSSALTANTVYTVTLKGGTGADRILDVAGNALTADYVWSFTTAVADVTAPVSVISSPLSGATVTQGIPVTITGTATDAGTITQVQVSVNGGTTWQAATGTTSWSFSWTPSTTGTVTIKSRATDQAGNVEVAGTAPAGNAINVTVSATAGQ